MGGICEAHTMVGSRGGVGSRESDIEIRVHRLFSFGSGSIVLCVYIDTADDFIAVRVSLVCGSLFICEKKKTYHHKLFKHGELQK